MIGQDDDIGIRTGSGNDLTYSIVDRLVDLGDAFAVVSDLGPRDTDERLRLEVLPVAVADRVGAAQVDQQQIEVVTGELAGEVRHQSIGALDAAVGEAKVVIRHRLLDLAIERRRERIRAHPLFDSPAERDR